jgi:hypothetical protein
MYLSNLSHKFIRPMHSNTLFELNHFTSHTSKISGFKLQLSGRLSTHKRVEKTSTKIWSKGYISRQKCSFNQTAYYISKNKIGSYCFKIWLGHMSYNFNSLKSVD